MKDIFSKLKFNILKSCTNFTKHENCKSRKVVTNLHDKTEHVIHVRNLKSTLNHGLVLKNFHRVVKFNKILERYAAMVNSL